MKTKRKRARTVKADGAAWRASWKGELRFGLVRFTVEAINVHSRSGGDIHFHQLHAKCHSRIEYRKVCPIHGEVDRDEIVMGYEYGRGNYVEIEPDELDDLRTKDERALTIEEFIPPGKLDEIYLDGRVYYLVPAEANDREPYHLLRQALDEEQAVGIGQVVFSGKEQLAVVRPRESLLVMAMLNYAAELRNPEELGVGGEAADVSTKNLRLARDLIQSMESKQFSIAAYEDHYRQRIKELIDAKRKGQPLVAPPDEDERPVINLMDALKKSLPKGKTHTKAHAKTASRPAARQRKAV